MFDWILSLGFLATTIGLAVFANRKAGQPWDDLKPRLIPWRLVLIASSFCAIIILVHIANLAGVETGPENSPFRRF
ncbi:MAG: hypothetical protein AAGJ32_09225 [Pseudomonadota bacterium]